MPITGRQPKSHLFLHPIFLRYAPGTFRLGPTPTVSTATRPRASTSTSHSPGSTAQMPCTSSHPQVHGVLHMETDPLDCLGLETIGRRRSWIRAPKLPTPNPAHFLERDEWRTIAGGFCHPRVPEPSTLCAGREDWHPIEGGYGYLKAFAGGACAHWTTENHTKSTRVSVDFRVIPGSRWLDDGWSKKVSVHSRENTRQKYATFVGLLENSLFLNARCWF